MERMKVVLAKEKRPLWRLSDQQTRHRRADETGCYLQRTRVADDPQLRGGVVNIGVGRESRSSVPSGTVVFVTDETLLVCDVAHDRGWVVVGMGVGGDERWKEKERRWRTNCASHTGFIANIPIRF